jgi:hypothetical protein
MGAVVRSAAFRLVLVAIPLLVPGCRELPIARGPEYVLGDRQMAAIVQTAAGEPVRIPLELRDGRPVWEMRYHAPASEPAGWRRAIGFVPMENIQPSINELILDSVNQAAAMMPERPTGGIVQIDSFRVVVNESEAKHREFLERQQQLALEMEREPSLLLGVSSSGGIGFGFGLPFENRPGLRGSTSSPSDAEPLFIGSSKIVNGQREFVGPPKELPLSYGPGITCEIVARVELSWPGGRSEIFPIAASCYANAPEWAVYDITTDIPKAVHGALDDLWAHLVAANDRAQR